VPAGAVGETAQGGALAAQGNEVGAGKAQPLQPRADGPQLTAEPPRVQPGHLDPRSDHASRDRVAFQDRRTPGRDHRGLSKRFGQKLALDGFDLVAGGATVLMTTQYLDEADQIVVLDGGRKVAEGTPSQLRSRIGGDRIDISLRDAADLPVAAALLAGAPAERTRGGR
jgi:hypothetical protein